MKLDGKVVIVTGASSGIGKAIALLFSKEGATVLAVARSEDKLKELTKESSGFLGDIVALQGDITKDKDIDHIVEYSKNTYKKIDVLVNNAGIMDGFYPLGEMDDELFNKVFDVNFMGAMKLCRKVIPIMEDQGKGVIVNMSSLAGEFGARAGAAYTSSKFALTGLTKNIAYMYMEKGIRCNAICPGGVDTGISEKQDVNQFGLDRVMKGSSNGSRQASPEEIANVALFLASDDSSYINGVAIVADGGWTAY